jgi:hypothetical protein
MFSAVKEIDIPFNHDVFSQKIRQRAYPIPLREQFETIRTTMLDVI